jgi:hypothetical protein
MKNTKRSKIATIILILSFALVTFPTVNAAEIRTYAFLSVSPNPVGVNQLLTLTMWLSNIPPLDSDGWAIPWKDFEVSITKPNETTETLGPFQSDPVGSQWVSYSPNMVGKYTFKMIYSGQTIGDNVYLASTSQTVEIIVQEDPIQLIPNNPLPTDYWQRPINAENREWWSISGNWLQNA